MVECVGGHNLSVIAVLLQGDSEDRPGLLGGGDIFRVHLEHEVLSTLLLLEYIQCLCRVAGCDYTVGHLTADDLRSGQLLLLVPCSYKDRWNHLRRPRGTEQ
jgi:hypothetical protein